MGMDLKNSSSLDVPAFGLRRNLDGSLKRIQDKEWGLYGETH